MFSRERQPWVDCGLAAGRGFALALSSIGVACSSATGGPANSAGATVPDDEAGADASVCQSDPAIEAYSANLPMAGSAGLLKFVLVSASPAPPVRGINSWTLKLLDASGTPVTNATFPTIKLWMPYMRHGSSIIPTVKSNGDGTYQITELDLIMAGVWQFTFTAQSASIKDTAMYTFCVGG